MRAGDVYKRQLMTRGNFVQRGNSYYIVYAETEATGYAGCTTTCLLYTSRCV